MSKVKCIIVEDQPPAQRILKKYIGDVDRLQLLETFSDAVKAMDFLQTHSVDLLFLDIHLPKISGIEFLKTIQHPPPVILTTAFSEYALEGYELNIVDYLLKPFSFQRFLKAVNKVSSSEKSDQRPSDLGEMKYELFIKSGHEHIKVALSDIIYINSDADYTEVHLPTRKILSSESLRHWIAMLDKNQFYRIHKSHIINTTKIEKIAGTQVFLEDGTSLPIGRTYKDAFYAQFLKG